jgi:hypothetical protein
MSQAATKVCQVFIGSLRQKVEDVLKLTAGAGKAGKLANGRTPSGQSAPWRAELREEPG